MAHTETVFSIIENLEIATKIQVASLMSHWKYWSPGQSSNVNSNKELSNLAEERRVVKEDGYYRLPHIKSEYQEHTRLLSESLVEVLKFNRDSVIRREHTISTIALRPDALILAKRGNQRIFIWLEQVNNEKPEYLQSKINALNSWQDAISYMTQLFGEKIKRIDFVTSDELSSFLSELNNLEEK